MHVCARRQRHAEPLRWIPEWHPGTVDESLQCIHEFRRVIDQLEQKVLALKKEKIASSKYKKDIPQLTAFRYNAYGSNSQLGQLLL